MSGTIAARPRAQAVRRLDFVSPGFDRHSGAAFILPAVLVILAFSIFPLLASLYLSLVRIQFVEGGVDFTFVGLNNYAKLLVGIDHEHFLGVFAEPSPVPVAVVALVGIALVARLARYVRGHFSLLGLLGRVVVGAGLVLAAWLIGWRLVWGGRAGRLC